MINLSGIRIDRAIIHNIHPKTKGKKSYVEEEDNLFELNENVIKILKERLISAAGKDSKAFELDLGETSADSVFELCKNFKNDTDDIFIENSKKIARKLADNQVRNSIPGGYLTILDCTLDVSERKVYIFIKAEVHKALLKNGSDVQMVDKIFMSPALKLFKIGIIYENEIDANDDPKKYKCFLYDEQFRAGENEPASYFYDKFLGMSISKNSKIMTKRFYDYNLNFAEFHVDEDSKEVFISAVESELKATSSNLDPIEFSRLNLREELLDNYKSGLADIDIESAFTKDLTLINTQIDKMNLIFPGNIKISATKTDYNNRVSVYQTQEQINNLQLEDGYTVIVINTNPL